MKSVDAQQFAANVTEYLRDSRSQAIVLTQDGKPCAIVRGLDYDDEQMQLVNSEEFWNLIEERRNRPTIPWEEVKRRLESLEE